MKGEVRKMTKELTKFEKLENVLYEYSNFDVEIQAIELDMKEIGQMGMTYSDMPKGNYVGSPVESNYNKLENLKIDKLCLELKKERIDNMLRLLNDSELKIIKLRYFEKLESREIARRLNVHETTLYKRRCAIFDKKLMPFAEKFKII